MKKTFILLSITIVFLCCCDPYINKKPYSYGDSIWVCEEANITYIVEMKYNDYEGMEIPESYAITNIDSKEVILGLLFLNDTVDVCEFTDKKTKDLTGKTFFSGTCKYYETKFVIKVNTETDILFNGKYDELIFIRQE